MMLLRFSVLHLVATLRFALLCFQPQAAQANHKLKVSQMPIDINRIIACLDLAVAGIATTNLGFLLFTYLKLQGFVPAYCPMHTV